VINRSKSLSLIHSLSLSCATSTGGNLTYEIPKGIADDCFTVDSLRGIVTTKGTFDREMKDMYTVPIYVHDSSMDVAAAAATTSSTAKSPANGKSVKSSQFDVATIVVRITDINDHAPEFRPGSCYPLAIPENNELSIIHQVVATDLDEGLNGDITYSITGKPIVVFFLLALHSAAAAAINIFSALTAFSNSL